MYACMLVPPISVGTLCRAKCGLFLDSLSNGGAPLKFPGLPLSNWLLSNSLDLRPVLSIPGPVLSNFRLLSNSRDLSSQIFGSSQISLDLSSQISGPPNLRGFLWNLRGSSQNLRGVLWNHWNPLKFARPMSRPVPGRPNLRGPLSNLRGSSQNLRGVLWNPFNFLKEFEDFHGIHTKQARFHRTPLKFERISWDILSNLAAHRILSIFRGTLWNPLKIEEEFENFHGDPFKFERIP